MPLKVVNGEERTEENVLMEDYEDFVQRRRLFLLKKRETREFEDDQAPTPTSLIRFYGKPILPPLLSRQQREEMQQHKTEARRAGDRRLSKVESRMAYVQTILQTVQLRKTPTLEELFQEPTFNTDESYGSVSQSYVGPGTNDTGMSSLQCDIHNEKVGVCFPPLTSTTYSSLFTNEVVTPQSEYLDQCLIDQEVKQGSHPETSYPNSANHPSLLSECVSHQAESSGILHASIETEDDDSSSVDEADSISGFFLHNTSNTIAKMPDIISLSPVDGEELERSGLELSFCKNVTAVHPGEDVCYTSSQHELVKCSQFPVETSEYCESSALTTQFCKDANEGSVSVLPSTDFLENSGFTQTLTTDHCSPEEDNQEGKGDFNPSEEPYKLSLQSLLKKSREYVRYHRMLKNQAKNAKLLERSQEKSKCREEEQSLSDKENNEVPCKGTGRQRSGTFSLETSPKSFGNEEIILRDGLVKEDNKMKESLTPKSTNLTVNKDNDAMLMPRVEGQEVMKEPKERADFTKQPFCLSNEQHTTCATSVRTFPTAPAPPSSSSPVPCHSQDTTKDGDVVTVAEIPNRQLLSNARSNVSDLVEREGVTTVLARSSLRLNRLESDISSLKVLLSTLSKNSDNHSQAQNAQQMDLCCKGIKHCEPFKNAQCQDQQERIQSNNHKNGGGMGPEPSSVNSVPLQVHESSDVGEGCLKDAKMKQQPKCSLSQAQRMRVPEAFRAFQSETNVPCESPVLWDPSVQEVDKTSEDTVEEEDSAHTLSLNQSFDVDFPSGLWHLDGPEGNEDSKGRGAKKKGLTPEGLSEGRSTVSKVKRRLLMNGTDDTRGKGGDTEAVAVLRPNSNIPRATCLPVAAVRWSEGHGGLKDKQQQMKLAHAAQVRALLDQNRRQQEKLLQALSQQNVSFPCPTSHPGLRDTLTFPSPQLSGPLSERYRPLVSALVQGFLTRRLMRTEKVAQLRRTIKDTQQFLQALQQQSPDKELGIRQDVLLRDRLVQQLRAAHFEIYDVFFSLCAGDRMDMIIRDIRLVRERELRRQNEYKAGPRGKNFLSVGTQKSLERKRGVMIQKKAAETHKGVLTRAKPQTGLSADQPQGTKSKQFRANSQRVPKNSSSSRPR